ncbi:MAG: hypothetical protein ACYC66_09010 [Chloroflexota bacterium]
MQEDVQQAVEEVLGAEREAEVIADRAAAEARSIRARAMEEAHQLRSRLLAEAAAQAEEAVAAARAEAERERDRRLAETDREIADLERSARQRIDAAVEYATAQLLGEPSISASPVEGDSGRHSG